MRCRMAAQVVQVQFSVTDCRPGCQVDRAGIECQTRAQGHKQGGRKGNELQHQHPYHHLQGILRQAITQGGHHDDADQHQAQQGRKRRKPGHRLPGAGVDVAGRAVAKLWRVTARTERQHQHNGPHMQHVPPTAHAAQQRMNPGERAVRQDGMGWHGLMIMKSIP